MIRQPDLLAQLADKHKTNVARSEGELIRSCLALAPLMGAWLARNNTGKVFTRDDRWLAFGVGGVGSSDLLGIGKDGVFLAIECKFGRTKTTQAQFDFVDMINRHGGRAGIVRTIAEAAKIIGGDTA